MSVVKASTFRQNLFHYLDACVKTGKALFIERGQDRYLLQSMPIRKPLGSVPPRPWIITSPESLSEFSPSEWDPDDFS